jgi:hypothetical protein
MRRQRAGEDHVAALQLAGAARPEFVMGQALVGPLPFDAAIVASSDADAAGRSEQRAVLRGGYTGNENTLQGAMFDGPATLAPRD